MFTKPLVATKIGSHLLSDMKIMLAVQFWDENN